MRWSSTLLVLLATAAFCMPCMAASPSSGAASPGSSDIATIYKAFLSRWGSKSEGPRNVAESADAPSADDLKQFAECAKKLGKPHTQWIPGATITNLRMVLDEPASLHFVDPKTWRPLDPGALMANGASVGAAVSAGMSQALITLSAITFNKAHDVAVFQFSFVCGSLCGTGSIIVFQKTQAGWVQSKTVCGGWQA